MALYVKGQSGNPGGRPKEIGKVRQALSLKITEKSEKLLAKAIEMAESGNEAMLKFLLDRITPKQIEAFKEFKASQDAKTIINNTLQQYTEGDISSEALNDVTNTIQKRVSVVEFLNMKDKVDALWGAKQEREGNKPSS